MKKVGIFLIVLLNFTSIVADIPEYHPALLEPSSDYQTGCAVTYGFSGGRLGDNLVAYLRAKWIAMKFNIPFLYRPFPYSERFALHLREPEWDSTYQFMNIPLVHGEYMVDPLAYSTLFHIPYTPEVKVEREQLGWLPQEDVDWNDAVFHEEVVRCLKPLKPVKLIKLSKESVNIGVHIRSPQSIVDQVWTGVELILPIKFPPEQYYTNQIRRLIKYYKNEMIHFHFFTDHNDPAGLIKIYQMKFIKYPNVSFGIRVNNTNSDEALFSDFYSIPLFDCFIGCGSNFSIVATKLGDYEILVNPLSAKIIGDQRFIDLVEYQMRSKDGSLDIKYFNN